MKLNYYPETDSLYIELRDAPGTETREVAAGVQIDLDADGALVGIDIDNAASNLDLDTQDDSATGIGLKHSNQLRSKPPEAT